MINKKWTSPSNNWKVVFKKNVFNTSSCCIVSRDGCQRQNIVSPTPHSENGSDRSWNTTLGIRRVRTGNGQGENVEHNDRGKGTQWEGETLMTLGDDLSFLTLKPEVWSQECERCINEHGTSSPHTNVTSNSQETDKPNDFYAGTLKKWLLHRQSFWLYCPVLWFQARDRLQCLESEVPELVGRILTITHELVLNWTWASWSELLAAPTSLSVPFTDPIIGIHRHHLIHTRTHTFYQWVSQEAEVK